MIDFSKVTVELAQDKPPPAGPIPREVLEYFRRKKLKPGFSYKDVWAEEHRFAFTVAKVMERSILRTVRDSIDKAIEQGLSLEEWKLDAEPMLERSGWREHVSDEAKHHRLRVIYETNMRVARANGQADRIQRTKKVLPFLVYELGPSKEHRPEHVAWSKIGPLSVDDEFWKEHMPPNDYGCKCRVRQISRREAEKLGGPGMAPDDERVPYELPDGRKGTAPKGVHPTFAYPMGSKGRSKALEDALKTERNREPGDDDDDGY